MMQLHESQVVHPAGSSSVSLFEVDARSVLIDRNQCSTLKSSVWKPELSRLLHLM